MDDNYTCCICKTDHSGSPDVHLTSIRSNVRRFADEEFAIWRCPSCRSIHARDEVDLDHYYEFYPFFAQELDWAVRCGYRILLRRLKKAGLEPGQRILDYGCGSGLLAEFLREKGYDAVGYDPYNSEHNDRTLLEVRYDCVIAQDVIEHAPDPLDMLRTLDSLAQGGAMIAIGMPNAGGINLYKPEKHLFPLHQPYHRHIFSINALLAAVRGDSEGSAEDKDKKLSWRLERYHSTPYTNMPVPFLSLSFLHHYFKCFDNNLDLVFERPLRSFKLWLNPWTYVLAFAGYFFCDDADIVAIFRTPG